MCVDSWLSNCTHIESSDAGEGGGGDLVGVLHITAALQAAVTHGVKRLKGVDG